MINDLASLTLYLISKIGKKIKVTRPGYEKSKLLGSLDNWEPGQLSRIIQSWQNDTNHLIFNTSGLSLGKKWVGRWHSGGNFHHQSAI